MSKPTVFLSHSSRDKFFVRELASRLELAGAQVWLDEAEINVGDSLTAKIGEAIDRTDFVAAVLSHHSVGSEWVQRELQAALTKEFAGRRVVVLPILLERVEIPPFLRDKLYADFSSPEHVEAAFKKLLRAIGLNEAAEKPIPSTPEPPLHASTVLTGSERRLALFEDIRIVSLEEKKSVRPNPEKALYHMYLRLSDTPPGEWVQIFDAERRFPRHSMWRRAWVDGDFIVIHCVPDELEKYHLTDLKEDVRNANAKLRDYLTVLARQEAREKARDQTERDQIKSLKGRLSFD